MARPRAFVRPSSLALALAVATLAMTTPARADRIADAEELFRRAKALVAEGKHAEACPLFASSHRLDPGVGTLLNLALCHEQIGRVASAWGEFRAVEQQSRADKPERAELARAHAEKLEPRISRMKITAPEELVAAGLVVKVDGEEKPGSLWTGVPVDVGTHVVEASAPSREAKKLDVKIDDEGVTVAVTIPELAVVVEPAREPAARMLDPEAIERVAASRARRTAGFVVGGIGAAALVTGVGFGVAALVNDDLARGTCGGPCARNSAEAALADQRTSRALTFANVANVTVPIGIAGIAVGVYLVVTGSRGAQSTSTAGVTPLGVRF